MQIIKQPYMSMHATKREPNKLDTVDAFNKFLNKVCDDFVACHEARKLDQRIIIFCRLQRS